MKAGTATSRPFFQLSADYSIEPGASLPGLVEDSLLLVIHGLGVLETIGENVTSCDSTDEPLTDAARAYWGAVYLLRQAEAVLTVATSESARLKGTAS